MRSFPRLVRIAMAAVLVPAVGAGCGGDSGGDDGGGDSPGASDSGTGEPAADAGGEADAAVGIDAAVDPLAAAGGFVAPKGSSVRSALLPLPPAAPFRALQLNLCNSGYAGCFQEGQSIAEGANVIRQVVADVVTLNEICEDDIVAELLPAMQETWPSDYVFWVFAPAASRGSGGPVTCTDGQRYGVAILGHVAAESWAGFEFAGDRLSNQSDDDEMRAWACAAATDNYFTCATHLENDNGDVALSQCQELMNPIVPKFWGANGGERPTVVGGDFNLTFSGNPDVQDCVPAGWYRKGDGDVQHIMATNNLVFDSSELLPMELTDHDAWLVRMITP